MKVFIQLLLIWLIILLAFNSCKLDELTNPPLTNNLVSISGKTNGDVKVGQSDTFSISLTNQGTTEIIINDIDFSQNDEGAFSFENGKPSFPFKIQKNKTFNIILRFTPTKNKLYTAILAVTGSDPSDTKTYTLKFQGTASTGGIKSVPTMGVFSGCDYPKAIRDLTEFDNSLHTDYITNHFKIQAVSIDSAEGKVLFRIKRCDNTNFKKDATCTIIEENPVYLPSSRFIFANDTACSIVIYTKFHGKDTKRYFATIEENTKYYCTKEITLSW